MLSSKTLAEFEEIVLHNTISYALRYINLKTKFNWKNNIKYFLIFNMLSINLGFFGRDLSLLNSKWKNIDCYLHENDTGHCDENSTSSNEMATLFNYEIASNEMSCTFNKVSKHCIVKENHICKNDKFYSEKYYYHLNRYIISDSKPLPNNIKSFTVVYPFHWSNVVTSILKGFRLLYSVLKRIK